MSASKTRMKLSKKLGIGGGITCLIAVMIGWVGFPWMLKSQINGQIALKKGSEMREMWSKLPFPLDFKVYLFNITNPVGIQNGEKPIVHEVGPYCYDEWKEKINLVDNEEDDTVEYNQRITWRFNPSKSNGLTGDEELVYPDLAMLSMAMITMAENPTMIGFAGKIISMLKTNNTQFRNPAVEKQTLCYVKAKAIDSIFREPSSLFIKAKAKEIMFDGLPIDCNVTDFAGSAVCNLLQMQPNDLVVVGDNLFKFSLFGNRNATVNSERIRVYRGIENPLDVGRVLKWNNQSALKIWSGDQCNAFNGTDTTIFHPFLYQNEDVVSFSPDICRSLSARYQRPTEIQGIRTNRYTADFGDQSSIPEEKCFCPTPETCLKKGAMDLAKCLEKPVVATLPHFYLADTSYLKNVSGLNPVQEDHEIFLDFEPMTGTPLKARKRLQFNMFVYPIEKFRLMKTFPRALLPLFWVEEGVELGDDIINKLKSAFLLITIVRCIKWILLLLGLGLVAAAGVFEFKRRQMGNKLEVTPMSQTSAIDSAKNSAKDVKKRPMNISTLQSAASATSGNRN